MPVRKRRAVRSMDISCSLMALFVTDTHSEREGEGGESEWVSELQSTQSCEMTRRSLSIGWRSDGSAHAPICQRRVSGLLNHAQQCIVWHDRRPPFSPCWIRYCLSLYTLCLKKIPKVFSYNSQKHCRIFIIFGTNITKKASNQKVLYFSTSYD